MWFLGHFALGYFASVAVRGYTKERFLLPLVFLASNAPDVDVFFEPFIVHRGVTHSVVLALVAVIALYLFFKGGLPYAAALLTHSLIGDYVTGPTQLFWPFPGWFGAPWNLYLTGGFQLGVELLLMMVMLLHLYLTPVRDTRVFETP